MQSSSHLQRNDLTPTNDGDLYTILASCKNMEEKKAIYLQRFNLSTLCRLGNEFTKYIDSRGIDLTTSSDTLNYFTQRFFSYIPGIKSETKVFAQANEIIINAIDRCSTIPENTAVIVLSSLEELKFLYDSLSLESAVRPPIANILQAFGIPLDQQTFEKLFNELTAISHHLPYFTESPNPF